MKWFNFHKHLHLCWLNATTATGPVAARARVLGRRWWVLCFAQELPGLVEQLEKSYFNWIYVMPSLHAASIQTEYYSGTAATMEQQQLHHRNVCLGCVLLSPVAVDRSKHWEKCSHSTTIAGNATAMKMPAGIGEHKESELQWPCSYLSVGMCGKESAVHLSVGQRGFNFGDFSDAF